MPALRRLRMVYSSHVIGWNVCGLFDPSRGKSCQMWTIKCTYFFDKCLKYDCLRMRIKVLFLDRIRVILSDINAFDSIIFCVEQLRRIL